MGLINNIKNFFTKKETGQRFEMITQNTGSFFSFRGNLYQSDVIRAAIRPKARAIGKAIAAHIQNDYKTKKTKQNDNPNIRMILEEPNPYMTGQMLQEKLITQLELNNNAFAYVYRENNIPVEIYPVDCTSFQMAKDGQGELYMVFLMKDGREWIAKYTNIIHLRKDFANNEFLGENNQKALIDLMEVVTISDQGIINAVKSSGVIRWLLKFNTALKREDLEKRAKEFSATYTATESSTGGVAAVGADADVKQIDTKEYVPNALQAQNSIKRIYSYFNTNEKIVTSQYTEDEWISYYENTIEPEIIQMSNEFTRKIFTKKERAYGNKIVFLSSNLTFASMQTKLQLVQLVDRGIMTPNEVREVLGYASAEGGDEFIRRLDTRPTSE